MRACISLTTTPARKHEIEPVLDSLIAQGLPVCLWVPRTFSRTGEDFGEWPDFFSKVNAVAVNDEGPITKLLPALRAGYDVVLTADDDMIYGPGWAAGLLACAEANPHAAIVYRGRQIDEGGRYKQARPVIGVDEPVNFVTGVYGALYRRKHFDPRIFVEWMDCPSNDDVVISAHLLRRGVPVKVATPAPQVEATIATETAPLYPGNNRGVTQDGINRLMWAENGIERSKSFAAGDVARMLERRESFAFSRWGDGEWIALLGQQPGGGNCDGHQYFDDLGEALRDVLRSKPGYHLGLQQYALDQCGGAVYEWLQANGLGSSYWVESDIFHHAAQAGDWSWMEALKAGPHAIVGPAHLRPLFPDAVAFAEVPDKDCWLDRERVSVELAKALADREWVAVGFCASMMSEVLIDDFVNCAPQHAYIDFGSVFDQLAGRKSRVYMRKGKQVLTDKSRVVCMATIPERLPGFEKVVATIAPQCDQLCVYLNGHEEVPGFLADYDNVVAVLAGPGREHADIGPNGKLHWADQLPPCYMLTIDDDIGYPSDYVETMVRTIDRYERKAACCVHGTRLHTWMVGHVSTDGREYPRTACGYCRALDRDTLVHVPGTGTFAWHSGSVLIPSNVPGDLYNLDPRMAEYLWQHQVPVVSVARLEGWLQYWNKRAHTRALYADRVKTRAAIEWLYSRPHPWHVWAPVSRDVAAPASLEVLQPARCILRPAAEPIDAVYLFLNAQPDTFELRVSIASLRRNMAGVRNVYVVGGDPGIPGVVHIEHGDPYRRNREANMTRKVLAACADPRISDQFILLSDDHFILQPCDAQTLPLGYTGDMSNYRTESRYARRVRNTATALASLGLPTCNYDAPHRPLRIQKDLYISAMSRVDWCNDAGPGILNLSVYGNLAGGGVPVPNAKQLARSLAGLSKPQIAERLAGEAFLSTANRIPAPLRSWLADQFLESNDLCKLVVPA